MSVNVCLLDVSELLDDMVCLSDSTSDEHSLSSYTSESFDDNGKTQSHQNFPTSHRERVFNATLVGLTNSPQVE